MASKIKITKDYIFKILKTQIKYLDQLNFNYAFLNDCIESTFLLEDALSKNIIKKNSLIIDYKKNTSKLFLNSKNFLKFGFKEIDLIFILRRYQIESRYLQTIIKKLKSKNKDIQIFDQTALSWEIWHKNEKYKYEFRKIKIFLKKNELIPSYYYNDYLIDYSKKIINKNNFRTLLDMCCGIGTVGMSLLAETKIKKTHFIDIKNLKNSIERSFKENNFKTKPIFTKSNSFSNLNKKYKFDCIVANPPYFYNNKINSNPIGYDFKFKFLKTFFKNVSHHLNDRGKIVFLKINDDLKINLKFAQTKFIKEILKKNKLKLISHLKIPGTIYEVMTIKK